jgi:hypothetical protein
MGGEGFRILGLVTGVRPGKVDDHGQSTLRPYRSGDRRSPRQTRRGPGWIPGFPLIRDECIT